MTSIKEYCPYCASSSAAFELLHDTQSKADSRYWYSLARCGVCKEVALVKFMDKVVGIGSSQSFPPSEYGRGNVVEERYKTMALYPEVTASDIPEDLPENVRTSFAEAEAAYAQNLFSSAAACYRKSIERAVKHLHPNGKGTLNARIRELEKNGLLPKTLIDLLDRVRILGNLSVHEDDVDPSREDCTVARDFSRLFLVYTYSLPAKVLRLSSEIGEQ